jgi:hypothetical protein
MPKLSTTQVVKMTEWFPNIEPNNTKLLSENDDRANCIAWAMGDAKRWWWPIQPGAKPRRKHHWPDACKRHNDMNAFEALMEYVGGVETKNEKHERGFIKVAFFATGGLTPYMQHAARLLPSGKWLSKCGPYEAIVHELHEMEGGLYGDVISIYKIPYKAWRTLRDDGKAEKQAAEKAETDKIMAELAA